MLKLDKNPQFIRLRNQDKVGAMTSAVKYTATSARKHRPLMAQFPYQLHVRLYGRLAPEFLPRILLAK